MKKSLLALFALYLLFITGTASATTYTYVGNPFTVINNDDGVTTSNFLSGSFSVFTPPPNNSALTAIDISNITSFSFSDGVHSFSDPSFVNIATGSVGNITDWYIRSLSTINAGNVIELITYGHGNRVDETTWYTDSRNQGGWAYNFGTSGTWTTSQTAAVPEPSSLLLLGAGLVGLAAWWWKHAA